MTTKTFLPLVQAQAKVRNVTPRLIVIDHPVGGLNAAELSQRIDAAALALREAVGA